MELRPAAASQVVQGFHAVPALHVLILCRQVNLFFTANLVYALQREAQQPHHFTL